MAFEFTEKQVRPGSREAELLAEIDPGKIPHHLAVIMDGNGRWAKRRKMPRTFGHRKGATSVRHIVENCRRLGVKALTLYAFSKENWKRPKDEVSALMGMLSEFLIKEVPDLVKNGIAFQPLGNWEQLPQKTVNDIRYAIEETKDGERMLLQVALNYGGRQEIVDACRAVAEKCLAGDVNSSDIDEDLLAENMYNPGVPDPDLLIRTSGEQRISNFLIWEIAYSELYITDILWPDFRLAHLLEAVDAYQGRERRFGGLNGSSETGS